MKSVWLELHGWERVTSRQEANMSRDRSQIMQGHCKDAHLLAKRCGKPLEDCTERSPRVSLNFNKITCPIVETWERLEWKQEDWLEDHVVI